MRKCSVKHETLARVVDILDNLAGEWEGDPRQVVPERELKNLVCELGALLEPDGQG